MEGNYIPKSDALEQNIQMVDKDLNFKHIRFYRRADQIYPEHGLLIVKKVNCICGTHYFGIISNNDSDVYDLTFFNYIRAHDYPSTDHRSLFYKIAKAFKSAGLKVEIRSKKEIDEIL